MLGRKLSPKAHLVVVAFSIMLLCCVLLIAGDIGFAEPPTPPSTAKTWLRAEEGHRDSDLGMPDHPFSLDADKTLLSLADSEIRQGYPSAGCGSEYIMRAGYDDMFDPDAQIMRGLVMFSVTSIPDTATVSSAYLRLRLAESWDYPGEERLVTTYRIASPWAEDIVSWSDAPAFAEAYGSQYVRHDDASVGVWYSFDVTQLVRYWFNGTYHNFGIGLRGPEHSGPDSSWKGFLTGETIYDPELVVTYSAGAAGPTTRLFPATTGSSGTIPSNHPILAEDFALSVEPLWRSALPGESISYSVSVSATGGFAGEVTLDVNPLPPDTTPTWIVNPLTLSPTTPTVRSELTLTTSVATPLGIYKLVITGTGGGLVHTRPTILYLGAPQHTFLPLVVKRYPAPPDAPVLHPIDNDGGEGEYTISWQPAIPADANTLQEYVGGAWQALYSGPLTTYGVSGKPLGTHRYRVLATNQFGSTPSQEQSVTVSDLERDMVFLFIGVADYMNMAPLTTSTRAGAPGGDLCCSVNDPIDLGGTHAVCSFCGDSATQGFGAWALNGCSNSDMLILTDRQATKATIQDAISNWLDARESRNTTVVISFSGHGTYGPDVYPLDEADGHDEYIAPYELACDPCPPPVESAIWLLDSAIRDDELEDWLGELASQRMVLFVDSCFSGGMIESSTALARTLAVGSTAEKSPVQVGDGLMADLSGPGRVVLTASTADQSSWESTALRNGVFTYYLVEALQSHAADNNSNGLISAEEAFDYLSGPVDDYVLGITGGAYHQNPQLFDGVPGQVDLTQPVAVTGCPQD